MRNALFWQLNKGTGGAQISMYQLLADELPCLLEINQGEAPEEGHSEGRGAGKKVARKEQMEEDKTGRSSNERAGQGERKPRPPALAQVHIPRIPHIYWHMAPDKCLAKAG